MHKKSHSIFGRIGRTLLAGALVTTLSLAGVTTAFADPVEPYWETPDAVDEIDSNLITTYGVRAGSAGPDFLGISGTNFDFTAGPATSTLQYTGTTAADLNTVTGAGLAIWATSSNVSPNPYYQNLYYNIAIEPTTPVTQATTWMSNPIGSWGDSNASPSNIGNVSTGAATIAGLEFSPDIIFGANKVTGWYNADPTGANSGTVIDAYFTSFPWMDYNPTWTNSDATHIWGQIYAEGQLATVADSLKTGTSKYTRYGDLAVTSAVDYEKAIRGNLLYIASQINTGAATQKTVAYLYSIDEDGIGYFFTPTATGLLVGDDTGAAPTSFANPNDNYAANNGTIDLGYRATLPLITTTFDSGNEFEDGIIMAVEDIWKANPACTVGDEDSLAGVDVIIYNTTTLSDLDGTTGGRNSSGVGINENYQESGFISDWATDHGFVGTYIAGDDFATSVNQGYGDVDATEVGMSPLLYCQRNYTSDKNAKAVWAFAQVYPALYGGNPNATYGYWLEKVYHIDIADIPQVGSYMTNLIYDEEGEQIYFVYDATTSRVLEGYYTFGYNWWVNTGYNDPYWSQFAWYSGSSRASYYSGLTASEEPATTIAILDPSALWTKYH
jgi:hypothetical protein